MTLLLASVAAIGLAQRNAIVPFFNVNLTGAQDATTSLGSGSITLSGNTLTFNNITYSGLTG